MYQNINLVRRDKLDLYDTRDASHPFNTFYEPATAVFLGPVELVKRKCTDIAWLIGFVIAAVISLSLVMTIYDNVELGRLDHGYDFRGDLCGLKQIADKKYMYFFDPVGVDGIGMCVDQCPSQNELDYCFYGVDGKTILDDYCYKTYETNLYLNRYCMPFEINDNRKIIENTVKSYLYVWRQLAHDIYYAKDIILAGYVGSLGIGFFFMWSLLIKSKWESREDRKLNQGLVWLYAIATPAGFVLIFMGFFQIEYDRAVENNCQPTQDVSECLGTLKLTMDVVKYLFIAASILYIVILLIHAKNIVEIGRDIQVFLAPFRKTHSMKFVPFMISSIQLGGIVIVYACVVGIMASGKRTVTAAPALFPNPSYIELYIQPYVFNIIPILFIVLIVFLQTFYLFQKFCYAFAVQVWYFSRQKSILDRPSARGIIFCFWKHLGTCVKGAVVMIVHWTSRSILRGFKGYLRKIKADNRDSKVLSFFLCCCTPCYHVFEYYTKYQCNMTIMHTALYGNNWIDGAEKSHYLFIRNLSRSGRFSNLFGYYRIIGMVFSSSCVYFFIYYFTVNSTLNLYGSQIDQLFHPWAAAFTSFIFGLYLSQNFTMAFDAVIESMLFCICADEEMFMGRERFCEDFILDYLNSITKEAVKKGLITVARKDQQENAIDDFENLNNLKPKEVPVVRPPTPPPLVEISSSSSEEEPDIVDLFAAKNREDEEDRKSKYSEEEEVQVKKPIPKPAPKEETFQFKKVDLQDIKDEQQDSDVEDEVQEDFGMVSKKKNVQYDDDEDDDIILDNGPVDTPKQN